MADYMTRKPGKGDGQPTAPRPRCTLRTCVEGDNTRRRSDVSAKKVIVPGLSGTFAAGFAVKVVLSRVSRQGNEATGSWRPLRQIRTLVSPDYAWERAMSPSNGPSAEPLVAQLYDPLFAQFGHESNEEQLE